MFQTFCTAVAILAPAQKNAQGNGAGTLSGYRHDNRGLLHYGAAGCAFSAFEAVRDFSVAAYDLPPDAQDAAYRDLGRSARRPTYRLCARLLGERSVV